MKHCYFILKLDNVNLDRIIELTSFPLETQRLSLDGKEMVVVIGHTLANDNADVFADCIKYDKDALLEVLSNDSWSLNNM